MKAPPPTTEQLLTSTAGFALQTASPAQRAVCRILDGLPLGELRLDPSVSAMVGGPVALEALPSERGTAPTELVLLAAVRTAKTMTAAAAALRMTQTVNVSHLKVGERARVSLVSLTLDLAAVAHRMLLETIRARKLNELLVSDANDVITLRHPSGRLIEISTVAAAKAGGGLIARWSAGVVFDEAPRMASSADSQINLGDMRTAVLGRLLPRAQVLYVGSPWSPTGDIYEMVQEHFGHPTEHLVVLRGTGPTLNPSWWTTARCEKLRAQNPIAYRCDVEGDFVDPEHGLFDPMTLARSTRKEPLTLPPARRGVYVAAIDPSEGSARGNAWSLVVLERCDPPPFVKNFGQPFPEHDDRHRYRVVLTKEWRGLSPAICWRAIAAELRPYGLHNVISDGYSAAANKDLAWRSGLSVTIDKPTATSKLEAWEKLSSMLSDGIIELSPDPVLSRDLLSVKKRITQSSATIVLPRTADGRHADLAAALCLALKSATAFIPYKPLRIAL